MNFADEFPSEAEDPHCTTPQAASQALRHLPWRNMVVLGDSVAAGVMDPLDGFRNRCFADRLGDALAMTRSDFDYRNLAERDLRLREIRDKQLATAVALSPDVALVVAGGNDALGKTFSTDHIRREMRALLGPLTDAGAFVVTVGLFDLPRSGLLPPKLAPLMAERFDLLDQLTSEVTDELGGLHIDTHHHPLAADPGIYAEDRIHANARGHAAAFAAIVDGLSLLRINAASPFIREPTTTA